MAPASTNVLVLIDLDSLDPLGQNGLSLECIQLIIGKFIAALYQDQDQRSRGGEELSVSWGVRLFKSSNAGLTPMELGECAL